MEAAARKVEDPHSVGIIGAQVEARAQDDAADDTVDEAAAGEKNPVEVVRLPELLEEHSLLHDTLLLSSVKTAGIDETELQPGC